MNVEQWLGENNQLGIDIWTKKYRYKDETFEQWIDRVSNKNEALANLIRERKFLFGGRALTNRGTKRDGSMFNCYSSGYCGDSVEEILQLNKNIALTYKAQGGQGVSLTKVRPKGTTIGEDYVSDGIVPFMEILNTTTASISQGGARKGALMISLDIRHKEAQTFITIKSNEDKILNANLSLEIDDEFMSAVEQYYTTGEVVVLHECKDYSGHLVEYDLVPIELYKLMIQTVYDWGEPGCIFTNLFRKYNLMEFDEDYEIATCNPCREQPLPKNFSCNLGSLNLSEFVDHGYTDKSEFNYKEFKQAVAIGVEALDTIIDENLKRHALKEQTENSKNYRNIGLGIFGYANALFKLGITYGSQEAKEFTDKLFKFFFKSAIEASINLAKEKGAFPKCKSDKIAESTIIKNLHDNNLIKEIKKYGLRNCSLISIAPTGSIATMMGCSGGCEPEFALSYNRHTVNLEDSYKVYCKSVKEYCQVNNVDETQLPEYFVASDSINWKDRIETQGIMQKWVDTAISSTINLAEDTTLEEIEQIYLYAWKQGLKGITLFRSGCKRTAILSTDNKNSKEEKPNAIINSNGELIIYSEDDLPRGAIMECSDDLVGKKRKLTTGCGSLHVLAFFDGTTGSIQEVYLSKGSTGGCQNFMIGLSRTLSLLFRAGVDICTIKDQLDSTGACPSYASRTATKHDTSRGSCCPMAIGNALLDMYNEMQIELGNDPEECSPIKINSNTYELKLKVPASESKISAGIKCPECGAEIQHSNGCLSCNNCGWSRCN